MGGGTGGCLGNWLCNLKQILMKCIKTVGAPRVIQTFFFTMVNIAKYCVCYLWDHNRSPIHSPTFTVDFFPPFHLILITNVVTTAQFISKCHVISCEDMCCWKNRTNHINFPTCDSICAGEEGRAGLQGLTQQGGCILTSMLHSREAGGSVLIPVHPLAALPRISIPTGSFWVVGLFSWARGWGYRVLVSQRAWKLLKDIYFGMNFYGGAVRDKLKHLCHHCRCFSEVNKGYLNYVYAKEFWLLQYILQLYSILKSIKLYVVLKDKELLLEGLILYRDLQIIWAPLEF